MRSEASGSRGWGSGVNVQGSRFIVQCLMVYDLQFAVRTWKGSSPHLLNFPTHQRPRVLRIRLRLRCISLCEPPAQLHAPHARCRVSLYYRASPSECVDPGLRRLHLPLSRRLHTQREVFLLASQMLWSRLVGVLENQGIVSGDSGEISEAPLLCLCWRCLYSEVKHYAGLAILPVFFTIRFHAGDSCR